MALVLPYILIVLACLLSSCQMGFTKGYSAKYGDGMRAVYRFSCLSGIVYAVLMTVKSLIMKEALTMTGFSFIIAVVFALINAVCILFMFGAFENGEASKVVLFSNLGLLVLPTLFGFSGILYPREEVNSGKIICLILVAAALFVNIDLKAKSGNAKKALVFYLVLFVMNGLAGITQAYHQSKLGVYDCADENSLMIMIMLLYAVMCFIVLTVLRIKNGKGEKIDNLPLCIGLAAGNGMLYGVSNLLTTISLATIDASIQYPILTGGAIVLGGLIGKIFGESLNWKFAVSSVLVILGTCAMWLLG